MNKKFVVYSKQDIADLIRPVAYRYPVKRVYLFGSYVKGSADAHSDIDLCVDTDEGTGLFTISGMRSDFSEVLGKEIDLITESSLKYNNDSAFVERLNQERECIYER